MSAELEIRIQPRGGDRYVIELRDQSQQEAGSRRTSTPIPFPFDLLRGNEGVPEEYGRLLFDTVFADPAIRSHYAGVVNGALKGPKPAQGPRLRVWLDISPDAKEVSVSRVMPTTTRVTSTAC